MWKRRKDEEDIETTVHETAPPAPVAPAPLRTPPAAPKSEAFIGKGVVIKGDIFSKEDVFLDGKILGTVDMTANKITIGLNGKVEATIKAREVVVLGGVHGDIQAVEKITIQKDAHLEGNLQSASISIEDGAYFKGSIDIVRPAPVKKPPEVKPAPRVEPAAASAPSTAAPTAGQPKLGGTARPGRPA